MRAEVIPMTSQGRIIERGRRYIDLDLPSAERQAILAKVLARAGSNCTCIKVGKDITYEVVAGVIKAATGKETRRMNDDPLDIPAFLRKPLAGGTLKGELERTTQVMAGWKQQDRAKLAMPMGTSGKPAQRSEPAAPPQDYGSGEVRGAAGYKGHRAGSRREQVHKAFDEQGKEAAAKLAKTLGIKETSFLSWCVSFRKEAGK